MKTLLSFILILLIPVGITVSVFADDMLNDLYGTHIGGTGTRAETKSDHTQAGRALAPAVKSRGEIVIDKRGRRIGMAIPNRRGDTNNDLLRLRSGKRVGNQLFDAGGRRSGIIIRK